MLLSHAQECHDLLMTAATHDLLYVWLVEYLALYIQSHWIFLKNISGKCYNLPCSRYKQLKLRRHTTLKCSSQLLNPGYLAPRPFLQLLVYLSWKWDAPLTLFLLSFSMTPIGSTMAGYFILKWTKYCAFLELFFPVLLLMKGKDFWW